MTHSTRARWATAARRLLFIVALISTGAVSTTLFRCFHPPGVILHPVGVFFWGAHSINLVLAFWLVARKPLWSERSAYLRVAAYLIAYCYGGMLFSVVQDAQTPSSGAGFHLPGTSYQDYARPSLDLPVVLTLALIALPPVKLSGLSLRGSDKWRARHPGFSLQGLLAYTTLAIALLAWIGFLTNLNGPKTYLRGMSLIEAAAEWTEYASFLLVNVATGCLVLWGTGKSWRRAMLSFPIAIAACGVATTLLVGLLTWLTERPVGGVLSDRDSNLWAFIAGQVTTFWTAFAFARLLGVQPTFRSLRAQKADFGAAY